MNRIASTLLLPVAALSLLACKRSNEVPEESTRTMEPGVTQAAGEQVELGGNAQAIESLASARCAREQRCNNFGADKKFASHQDCMTKMKAEKYDELNAEECRGGINRKELEECLQEIRNDDCNNPLDTLGRLTACRSSDLCKATAP